jgi:hypothetical protein
MSVKLTISISLVLALTSHPLFHTAPSTQLDCLADGVFPHLNSGANFFSLSKMFLLHVFPLKRSFCPIIIFLLINRMYLSRNDLCEVVRARMRID